MVREGSNWGESSVRTASQNERQLRQAHRSARIANVVDGEIDCFHGAIVPQSCRQGRRTGITHRVER